jgi:RNA polymerase sigma factor (TIGR02999 family)
VDESKDITGILAGVSAGDRSAIARLLPLVYGDLRQKAGSLFRGQNPAHTLQPTALVHEVYLKLARSDGQPWESRRHFMAVAATAMRQVLADHARDRRRQKRGGDVHRVTLQDVPANEPGLDVDLVALDEALAALAVLSERQARIVELRFLAGLNANEIAELLEVSRRTVELDWRVARAWLRQRLADTDAERP